MMKVTVESWGISIELFGFITHLYPGDLYIRIPLLGEAAWNTTGLHANRIPKKQ